MNFRGKKMTDHELEALNRSAAMICGVELYQNNGKWRTYDSPNGATFNIEDKSKGDAMLTLVALAEDFDIDISYDSGNDQWMCMDDSMTLWHDNIQEAIAGAVFYILKKTAKTLKE